MKISSIITTVLVGALSAIPTFAADIALRSWADVQNTVVRLGDVAEIRAASDEDAQRLAALPLMPAPAPGTERFLRMREVQDLLAAHGEDMGGLNFQGELVVEISSAQSGGQSTDGSAAGDVEARRREAWFGSSATAGGGRLTDAQANQAHDQLERLIVEHLDRSSGRKAQRQVKFNVSAADLGSVPSATSELKCAGGNAPWNGKQRFVVSFATARGEVRFPVFADVTVTQPVVVAVQPIERGDVLTAAAVELQQWENAPAASGRRAPIESVETLLGMEATRPIQAGEVILADDVRPQLLVKRGEEIAVVARGGGIRVRTLARAKQDGARGELVQVESLETREPFDAVVVGVREAVVFSGSAAPAADDVAERPFRRRRQ